MADPTHGAGTRRPTTRPAGSVCSLVAWQITRVFDEEAPCYCFAVIYAPASAQEFWTGRRGKGN
jgi:hypothetical protein